MFRPTLAMAKVAKSKVKAKAKAKAMAIAAIDERQMFLLLRPSLCGEKAEPLRAKRFINDDLKTAARNNKEVAEYIKTHTMPIVSSSVRALMRKNIFASDEAARSYFPGMHIEELPLKIDYAATSLPGAPGLLSAPPGSKPASPPHEEFDPDEEEEEEFLDDEDEIDENDKDDKDAIETIPIPTKSAPAKSSSPSPPPPSQPSPPPPRSQSREAQNSTAELSPEDMPVWDPSDPPEPDNSPFSLYVPFVAQHYLLAQIQRILERACMQFAQRALPGLLQRNHWDCVEAIELDIFVRTLMVPRNTMMLRKSEKDHPTSDVPQEKSLFDLLRSIATIRHLTVHRRRMTLNNVEQILTDADRFARILAQSGPHAYRNINADPCVKRIASLRKSAQSAFRKLRSDKTLMDARLAASRVQFANERARINRREEAMTQGLLNEYTSSQEYMTGQLYWSLWHGRTLAAWLRLTWLSWRQHLRSAYLWRT